LARGAREEERDNRKEGREVAFGEGYGIWDMGYGIVER